MGENIDDIIRKKLQAYKSEQNIAWEDFKSKLDSELGPVSEETNTDIDLVVKDKLKGYQVPFEASHWAILRDKLRIQLKNLEHLYISKVFEVITILLLLFHFLQFVFITPHASEQNESLAILGSDKTLQIKEQSIIYNNTETVTKNSILSDDVNTLNKGPFTNASSIVSETETDGQIIINTLNKVLQEKKSNLYSDLDGAGVLDHQLPAFLRIRDFTQVSGHCQMEKPEVLASRTLSLPAVDRHIPIATLALSKKPEAKHKLNLFIDLDNTLVNTPPDMVYANIGKVLFNSFDYGGGVNYLRALSNRFDLGVGLGYSTISYAPQKVEEVFIDEVSGGTYSVHLNNIFFSIVNMPTTVNYHFIKKDNWSLFATAGLQASFVAEAEYDAEFVALRPTSVTANFQDINSGVPEPDNGPRLFEKSFNNGLLEGGALADNFYLSTNFGIGITKSIGKHIDLISSLSYRNHMLGDGIGPNNDKLSAVSYRLGFQYDLN